MPSVFIGIPVMRGQIETDFFMSLLAARRNLFNKGIEQVVISNESSFIPASRNVIASKCNADYLMFIDSDMVFPSYGISRLMSREKDIIGGLYVRKTDDHKPLIFGFDKAKNFREIFDFPPDEPFQVDGIGTGFLLIHKRVLQKFADDAVFPFSIIYAPNKKELGEDLSFCHKARNMGFEIWCDPTIRLGHIGTTTYDISDFHEKRIYHAWKEKNETYDNDISGWMTKPELNWLKKTASGMDSVVEIGSWMGRSTHALLSGCRGTVYAVDHFQGSPGEIEESHKLAQEIDIYEEFQKNVGNFDNLKVLKMPSEEAVNQFKDKSIDMVFIDGSHQYEDVKKDIEMWLPKAKKLICGHDYQWIWVEEAVTEKFGMVDTADTIWIKKLY